MYYFHGNIFSSYENLNKIKFLRVWKQDWKDFHGRKFSSLQGLYKKYGQAMQRSKYIRGISAVLIQMNKFLNAPLSYKMRNFLSHKVHCKNQIIAQQIHLYDSWEMPCDLWEAGSNSWERSHEFS